MGMMTVNIQAVLAAFKDIAEANDWHQFHSPKNLAMALGVEAAELMANFQWLDEAQSRALPPAIKAEVADEAADVLMYLLALCDKLELDLPAAVESKIARNQERFGDKC